MRRIPLFLFFLNSIVGLAFESKSDKELVDLLKNYIQREQPEYIERENQKRSLAEDLDRLNGQQNLIRERVISLFEHQQELSMSLENLSIEMEKQKALEAIEKRQVSILLKMIYKIKRDGTLPFLISSAHVGDFAGRFRLLYRSLRTHARLTQQLKERSARHRTGERKLSVAKEEIHSILRELSEQQELLAGLLAKKRLILKTVYQKQQHYRFAVKEFERVSKQLNAFFSQFENERRDKVNSLPQRYSLAIPIGEGRLVKKFGKFVHPKFGTITYHKGVEIQAEHNSPVHAILPGTVEFEGWVKGLGKILIIHHGGGFYSLSGHLFKTTKKKGDGVERGELVGYVGDTGESDKPSLYFELRDKNKAVDPLSFFLKEKAQALRHS